MLWVGLCGGTGWKKRRGWTDKKKSTERGREVGEVEMGMVKDGWRGLRDGQRRQRYTPEVARLVRMSVSAPVLLGGFFSLTACLVHSPTC